ncbi:hydroxymethylglutaryl-CoA reductase, degradative [Sandaracinus amylolyticus]|uniref:3-hydroxy-3-methylglutaryl coenzyme A reductase n=1 Tax=Sandaracinus amylolyticus TaxID=927083 RepID=A0A0F6VZL9_9BACT|nr:hydroxymethylglutaryl-CoA reductase, degradative [Sandaracinus amylolyticus]AKF03655.1 Hydroxymethylglutaryl-CoA reductase [Sandaracinus amylolyticus]
MVTSRLPGFYKLTLIERRRLAEASLGLPPGALDRALEQGGLDPETADKTIENVIGTYAMPLALTLNVQINGRDYLAPMVVEEPSVVAAASNASKMIRAGGGFEAEADAPIMISQIQLDEVPDVASAREALLEETTKRELLALADAAVPNLVARGGGARDLEVRDLGDGWMVVHVLVDCRDAMGANLVNTVAESLAPRVADIAGGRIGLRILSNLTDRRMVRVKCRVPASALEGEGFTGEEVRDGIVRASEFASRDPYRAATHNKGIMNGIDPVVIATGNDWRAVEAGAHAWAAKDGKYGPLCTWRVGEDGALEGQMELPLALGIVGGTLRVHQAARFSLGVAGVDSAQELAMVAACVGVSSNLSALRALATVGIQRGHMALHARSVAIAAGARGDLVEIVAAEIHEAGTVTVEAARAALKRLAPDAELQAAE